MVSMLDRMLMPNSVDYVYEVGLGLHLVEGRRVCMR